MTPLDPDDWTLPHVHRYVKNLGAIDHTTYDGADGRVVTNRDDANIITSEISPGLHAPVLDIDFAARLIPSSTPGHFHLYLDKAMTWDKYRKLLVALAEAGIIEQGWAGASITNGYSSIRKRGVYKQEEAP